MDECSFEQTIELPGGGYQTSKCMYYAEILFEKDPCYGLCFACAYRKVLADNKRLREALMDAIVTIRTWHGSPGWEIYKTQSPEMKKIEQALKGPE